MRSKNQIKVLSALSIAASDTREDTLKSVVLKTIHQSKGILKADIGTQISKQFSFTPFEIELNALIDKLQSNDVLIINNGYLELSDKEKATLFKLEIELEEKEKQRFQNFKNFIADELESDISIPNIKKLWNRFLKYLYNCFYEYGHEAIKTLHPHITNGNNNGTYSNILKSSINEIRKIDADLVPIFDEIVNRFADFASKDDLEFLNDLAQKTLSFTSLGIKPELASESIDRDIVDWILYLDTNVLYSLLNLRYHPENQACNALVQLLLDNRDYIKIKLRYTSITYKELRSIRNDFDSLNISLTDSSIKALLRSKKLDSFAAKFYENLLKNRESTIHPSKIIDFSPTTLKTREIDISRTDARLENISEEIIDEQISLFYKFIEDKNRNKEEFTSKKKINFYPISKSEKQVRHDVSLREIILDSRKLKQNQEPTLNNIKFFGLTLDDTLMSFDRKQTKDRQDKYSFPVFFKPSFLLNRLTKILPIQTSDYKLAFIKSITTKGFFKDGKNSNDVLTIVNYLKSQGIDNEEVIYNMITQDIFIEQFSKEKNNSDFNEGEFIHSEINRQFETTQKELLESKNNLSNLEKDKSISDEEKNRANEKKVHYVKLFEQYEKAASQLQKRVKILEKTNDNSFVQPSFDFEGATRKKELKEQVNLAQNNYLAEVENSIENFKDQKLKSWQKSLWWNLFWVVPILSIAILLTIGKAQFIFDFLSIDPEKINEKTTSVILYIINIFFVGQIYFRLFNQVSINAKYSRIRVPEDLKKKLREAQIKLNEKND